MSVDCAILFFIESGQCKFAIYEKWTNFGSIRFNKWILSGL